MDEKMRKKTFIYIILILFFISILLSISKGNEIKQFLRAAKPAQVSTNEQNSGVQSKVGRLLIKTQTEEHTLSVEIADTPAKRETGLMNRTSIKDEEGMIFIFEKSSILNFWMKNTLIPLDIIFIDADHKVINIAKNTKVNQIKEQYKSEAEAKYVLEINGGLSDKLKIFPGDDITLIQ